VLRCRVNISARIHRQPAKPADPRQGSLGFDLPEESGPVGAAGLCESPAPVKATPPKAKALVNGRRCPPARARISFEAPARLERKLVRVARDQDRSKTAILREAVESYLKKIDCAGGVA